jgi:hypothetical protein
VAVVEVIIEVQAQGEHWVAAEVVAQQPIQVQKTELTGQPTQVVVAEHNKAQTHLTVEVMAVVELLS